MGSIGCGQRAQVVPRPSFRRRRCRLEAGGAGRRQKNDANESNFRLKTRRRARSCHSKWMQSFCCSDGAAAHTHLPPPNARARLQFQPPSSSRRGLSVVFSPLSLSCATACANATTCGPPQGTSEQAAQVRRGEGGAAPPAAAKLCRVREKKRQRKRQHHLLGAARGIVWLASSRGGSSATAPTTTTAARHCDGRGEGAHSVRSERPNKEKGGNSLCLCLSLSVCVVCVSCFVPGDVAVIAAPRVGPATTTAAAEVEITLSPLCALGQH